jgi:general secretion pathway protein G
MSTPRVRSRRRRVIVEGFQARFVVVQLLSLAGGLAVFAVLLFGPLIYELLSRDSEAHGELAALFLHLHASLWPLLVGLFASLAAIFVLMSHRVAGPVYRFRLAFRAVAQGRLDTRVKTRDRDYLGDEAADLDAMIRFLSARVGGAQRRIAQLETELAQVAQTAAPSSRLEIARAAETLTALKHELQIFHVDADAQPTYRPDSPAPVASAAPASATRSADAGFSLIEIMIATGIIGTIAAIAIPAYMSALDVARVARAVGDINAIGKEVTTHLVLKGCFPSTLVAIGRDTLRDPWGRAYVYGVLDPAGGGGGGGGGRGRSGGSGGGGGGGCSACSGGCINQGQARKDRRLVPINADFDLYSVGKDGKSASPLTAQSSQDDIIRANNGGFIGLASTY